MMRTMKLYGGLKKKFGPKLQFDAVSPADMIRAAVVLVDGFEDEIKKGSYHFIRGDLDTGIELQEVSMHVTFGSTTEVHLVPVGSVHGRGAGKILLGAVMIGAAFATGGVSLVGNSGIVGAGAVSTWSASSGLLAFSGFMGTVAKIGLVMMLGGISSLLTPKTKLNRSGLDRNESFLFSGATNTALQGDAIPLVYGEVWAGSRVISAGIDVEQIQIGNSAEVTGDYSGTYQTFDFNHAAKGGKSGKRNSSTEAPNNLQSNATVRIIDLISEGPCYGLSDQTDKLKAVYLDDVVVQNDDDSYNFQGLVLEERPGDPTQTPMPGFSSAESETDVSSIVTQSTPVVRSVAATNDDVRVTINVPALYEVEEDNGSIKPATVEFTVEIQPNGGSYSEVLRYKISGKTNSTYQVAFRIELPSSGPWNVRVSRVTADSGSSFLVNDIYWSSFTSIVNHKLYYPNCAIVGLSADARQFGSNIPSRSYLFKGREVSIPSNYNPTTRTYTGVWNGTFSTGWTDNPAWILYDLLTNTRYGLGDDIPADFINKWALYEIGEYCDELVDDGMGGTEPRYTINTQIVDRGEAWDLLNSIVSVFRGMFYWGAGTIEFSYDHDEEPTKVLSPANVVGGVFNYSSGQYRSNHSVAVIAWNDPELYHRVNYEVVEDRDLIAKYGYKPIETTAWGCTSRGQAHRTGKWILDTEKYGEFVSFSVSLDNADLRPGTVIEINDPEYNTDRFAGRLESGSTTTVLQLDSEFTKGANGTVRVQLTDGTVEERTVTTGAGSTSTLTVSSAFSSAPGPGAMWSYAESGADNRLWRVVSVEENDDLSFNVFAIYHDPNKFTRVESDIDLPPNTFSTVPEGPLAQPTEIDIKEFFYRDGDTVEPGSVLSWTAADDPRVTYYEWQVKLSSEDDWERQGKTARVSTDLRPLSEGTYDFRVRSCNDVGLRSLWAASTGVSVTGIGDPIPAVTNLSKGVDDEAIQAFLYWDLIPSTETRPLSYRIKYHASSSTYGDAVEIALTEDHQFIVTATGYYWVEGVFSLLTGTPTGIQVTGSDLPAPDIPTDNVYIDPSTIYLPAKSDGTVTDYTQATADFIIRDETGADVSSNFNLSTHANDQILTVSYVGNTINITGGFDAGEDVARLTVKAQGYAGGYTGTDYYRTVTLSKGAYDASQLNNRNDAAVVNPTVGADALTVDSTALDGSAAIEFEWAWAGTETDIDVFEVFMRASPTGGVYAFGTSPEQEQYFTVPADKRTFRIEGQPSEWYYTFGVRAVRFVDLDIDATGVKVSNLVKAEGAGEDPLQPNTAPNWGGDLNSVPVEDVTDISMANGSAFTNAVTFDNDGTAIEHTESTDGSCDIELTWNFTPGGTWDDANYANGYLVFLRQVPTNTGHPYTIQGDGSAAEQMFIVNDPDVKYLRLDGVPADHYYTFGVCPYRHVDTSVDVSGLIRGAIVQPSYAGTAPNYEDDEDPYLPNATVNFNGVPVTSFTDISRKNDLAFTNVVSFDGAGNAVDHFVNTDGSVNIELEWSFTNSTAYDNANYADGYQVFVRKVDTDTGHPYTIQGDGTAGEQMFVVDDVDVKYLRLDGVPADHYYTFGVRPFRNVDTEISASGKIVGAIVQPSYAGPPDEDPYQPDASVDFTGTLDGTPITDVTDTVTDFDNSNNQNNAAIPAITLPSASVTHTTNANGTVNVTFNWTWDSGGTFGDENIDGFVVYCYVATPAEGALTNHFGYDTTDPESMAIEDGGKRLYLGSQEAALYQYDLYVRNRPSSAVFVQSKDLSASTTAAITGVTFKPDGKKAWIADSNGSTTTIRELTLSTPWDISTASVGTAYSMGSYGVEDLEISPDGTSVLFVYNASGNAGIGRFAMGSAWTLSGAGSITTRLFSAMGASHQLSSVHGLGVRPISPPGACQVVGLISGTLRILTLTSVQWTSVASAGGTIYYDPGTAQFPSGLGGPTGLTYSDDGTIISVVNEAGLCRTFVLSTSGNASTASDPPNGDGTLGNTYAFGTDPDREVAFIVPAHKRDITLPAVSADACYTFGIKAFRKVDSNITTDSSANTVYDQIITYPAKAYPVDVGGLGTLVETLASSIYDPYKPQSADEFVGRIAGTLASPSRADEAVAIAESSITPNVELADVFVACDLAATLTINAPTGTPTGAQTIRFRLCDAGSSQTLSWNAVYREIGVTKPTSTTAGKTLYVTAMWNGADLKWDLIDVKEEA